MAPRMARSWTPDGRHHGSNMAFHGFFSTPTCSCCPDELSSTSDPSSARLTHHAVPISPVTLASAVMCSLLSRLDPSLAGLQEALVAVAQRRDAYRRQRPPRPRDPGEDDFTGGGRRKLPALPSGGRIPRSVGDGAEVEGIRLPSRPVDPSRISGKSESDSRTGPESASLSFVDLFRGVGRVLGDRRIPIVGGVGGVQGNRIKSHHESAPSTRSRNA